MAAALAVLTRKQRALWYWGSAAALALLLALVFSVLQLRVLFHGQLIDASRGAGTAELGLDIAILLIAAHLCVWKAAGELAQWLMLAAAALTMVAASIFALGALFYANPLFRGFDASGNAVINTLLIGYALPAGMFATLARRLRARAQGRFASFASSSAIICLFAYVSLEVRRIFNPYALSFFGPFTTQGELYAYSAAWLLFGILLLAYGLWQGAREARLASACFVVAAVLKVFLIDLAGLDGILRAFSFIGLGVVLIGIGLIYQRFVFTAPALPTRVS
jgi:uncharacterized membrane protein